MSPRTSARSSKPPFQVNEEIFRLLFEHHPLPMWMYDLESLAFLEVNIAAVEKYGYTREEFLKMTLRDIRSPESETGSLDSEAKWRLELQHATEWRHTLKSGRSIDVEISSHTLAYQGRKAGFVIVQEVTERKAKQKVILDSELLHRSLFNNMQEGFVYCRMIFENDRAVDYEYLDVNTSFEKLTGLKNVVGRRATEVIPGLKESNPELFEIYGRVAETGLPERFEIHVGPLDAWLSISAYSMQHGFFAALFIDITERKRAEEKLSKSERRFHQLFDEAPVGYHELDTEGRIVAVNNTELEMLGYTTEELLHHHPWEFIVEPDASRARVSGQLDGTAPTDSTVERTFKKKDGTMLTVLVRNRTLRNDAKAITGIRSTLQDITERRKGEEHLRQSEEQFRLIAENVADMIAVLDLDGRRIYYSPSYRSILGDPESLRGTDGFQEVHPDDVAMVKQVFRETVKTGIGQRIEYRFLRKDGSERTIDSKGSVIRDGKGKIIRVVVVSRDVTEEKMLAAQFLRSQRMESIGTLAAGIAHDLNNVLAPIMMAIEVLRTKMADQGGQRILSTIETSAKRGADIVKQVLAFGRGVKGDRILVQLKHVVNEVAKIASETMHKSIEIRTDIPRDLWTVSADPTQMHQVLLNMLVNARDAMPKGGTLTISAENVKLDENYSRMNPEARPGAYVSIVITDTGTGIPAGIREKIFEPFFTTKEIGMGTGLGLSTSLAIVKSHEGFINLQSEEGKGTTFRIYIPATGTTSGVTAAREDADLPLGKGEMILIIDDEAAIREITKETLQAYGYKAMTASDGAEGVAVFAENKENIKVVITDIMMPVMDGTAAILVLQKIKPDVKIIAASGLAARAQFKTPSESNVQAFLTKPYTAEMLLKALAAALR